MKGGWDGMVGELVRQVSIQVSNYNFKSIAVRCGNKYIASDVH